MSVRRPARTELKDTGYELFIGALSVLSILNLVLMYVVRDPDLDTVLLVMNGLLSTILLIDFVYRLLTAPSRSAYFFRQFGWADLLASLPFPQLKILRVFRLVRVGRLLRARTAAGTSSAASPSNRAGSALLTPGPHGHPGARVRQPVDAAPRAGRAGANITHGLRRHLVRHRHHLHGRLRRPVPGDDRGPGARVGDHRHRRRHLRHVHRLPGEPLPRASAAGRRPSSSATRASGSTTCERCSPSSRRPSTSSTSCSSARPDPRCEPLRGRARRRRRHTGVRPPPPHPPAPLRCGPTVRVRGAQRVDAEQHQRHPDDAEPDPEPGADVLAEDEHPDEQLEHRRDELDQARR